MRSCQGPGAHVHHTHAAPSPRRHCPGPPSELVWRVARPGWPPRPAPPAHCAALRTPVLSFLQDSSPALQPGGLCMLKPLAASRATVTPHHWKTELYPAGTAPWLWVSASGTCRRGSSWPWGAQRAVEILPAGGLVALPDSSSSHSSTLQGVYQNGARVGGGLRLEELARIGAVTKAWRAAWVGEPAAMRE